MARCSGCSQRFDLLVEGTRCGRCTKRAPRPNVEEWGMCNKCGEVFEFMDQNVCFDCSKYTAGNGVQQASREAIANPVNVRTHTNSGGGTSAQFQGAGNQQLQEEALRIMSSMSHSYTDAHARTSGTRFQGRIAPSKLKLKTAAELGIPRPVKRLNLKIVKLFDFRQGKYLPGAPFHADNTEYPDDTPMATVLEDIRTKVDNAYKKDRDYRVYDINEFTMLWASARVAVDPSLCTGTLRDLWRACSANSLLVSPADVKKSLIEWAVAVNYDEARNDTDDDDTVPEFQGVGAAALQANTSKGASAKRMRTIIPSGRNAYVTRLGVAQSTGIVHIVLKGYWTWVEDSAVWVEEQEPFKVVVDKESFASGVTKKAVKMYIDKKKYAAKYFYDIDGSGAVSHKDNLVHLKDELLRGHILEVAAEKFVKSARHAKISTYDIRGPAESFILTVVEGPSKGRAWLVDPLFENAVMRKFSGTDLAGANSDLAGRTCDAFAHFSLDDSDGSVVFVDIQGIDSSTLPITSGIPLNVAHSVTLFDVMIHSSDGVYGLGDQGWTGIRDFVTQHKCNTICAKLGLRDVRELWDEYHADEHPALEDKNNKPNADTTYDLDDVDRLEMENDPDADLDQDGVGDDRTTAGDN
ncbi:atypical/Alpha protein kinase [Coprinopsis cinerea okayama7|uniref:Atypical/Alpha protein kinase n=1 Tax=Coprinopsis cinerea (strain Okayama-7 / 130 / ATCC MYA-4618 / FGSC 9003) TaxID=240176 RepID=A8P6F4_COPC7|nr:atypical/Alpha protein kinase [Coprinopsis cinerea okayama7\|eukprot:XP_001839147.1 atypical/Alpha protein kinase [Coprinopsis cinerea okayama7\